MRLRGIGALAAVAVTTGMLALAQTAAAGTQLWDFESGASDWDTPNGTWEVNGGMYQEVSGTDPAMHSVVGDASWTDYVIEATVRVDEGNWAGIAFRAQSDFEYYVYYMNVPDNKSELWKHNDGAFDARENLNDIPGTNILIENGVGHAVKVVVAGDTFELWIDGEMQSQDTDASYAAGKAGVWAWATMASFDDFSVTGAGIADNGTPVEPQGKLTTAWGRMKDTR